MASSSFVPESSNQDQQLVQQQQDQPERAAYVISGSTIKLQERQLRIQVENPVDFTSLTLHVCNIQVYYAAQGWMHYFDLLNGPTYKVLVRHFLVRATIFYKKAAEEEERNLVLLYPELVGKTREEMQLEPFTSTEI